MDELEIYKNFNMLEELHIAGNFIYDAISVLNRMNTASDYQSEDCFSFLYYASVGIERLLKILIVLYRVEGEDASNIVKKYRHNHRELNKDVMEYADFDLEDGEKGLLDVLTVFYKDIRYGYFTPGKETCNVVALMESFLNKIAPMENRLNGLDGGVVVSKVLGGLTAKYYQAIKEYCLRRSYPLYTYELKNGSNAEKVFIQHTENSLQEQKTREVVALRELIIFLRNAKESCGFLRYLDGITPLDLDAGMMNIYLEQLCRGMISQELIEEVYEIYEEEGFSESRIDNISGIGNANALF